MQPFHRLFAAVLYCLIVVLLTTCSKPDTESELSDLIYLSARYDVNRFVLQRMQQNRIVMLADAGHGRRLYLQSLVRILNHWLDTNISRAATADPVCPELILVLERDSAQIESIRRYFESADFRHVFDIGFMMAPQFTCADLEFYSDLRALFSRLNDYNRKAPADQQLYLSLFGPEKPLDLHNWSVEKRDRFFLYERDEYSSQRLIDHLTQHPGSTALVFYGAGHFARKQVQKPIRDTSAAGYYLAYYLTREFADNGGVYVLGQISARDTYAPYSRAFAKPGKDYALDNLISTYPERLADSGLMARDGWIVLFDEMMPSLAFYQVQSTSILRFVIESLPDIVAPPHDYYFAIWQPVIAYLQLVPAETPPLIDPHDTAHVDLAIDMWQHWLEIADIDYVGSIEDLSLWDWIIDNLARVDSSAVPEYLTYLKWSLGPQRIYAWNEDKASPAELAEHFRECLHLYRKYIVVEWLVHGLWIMTDDERESALSILAEETGRDFKTPKEWMVWWYSEGCKYM